jgi:hypothetical protein
MESFADEAFNILPVNKTADIDVGEAFLGTVGGHCRRRGAVFLEEDMRRTNLELRMSGLLEAVSWT